MLKLRPLKFFLQKLSSQRKLAPRKLLHKKLDPSFRWDDKNVTLGGVTTKLLFLFLFSILAITEAWALPPDPNAPATIQSVIDADKDIVETLVSLISGLAATASDLIYMNTPSSVTAMNTNTALLGTHSALMASLATATAHPTKLTLTGYLGFANPPVDLNNIPATLPIAPVPNSGTLVLDTYDALDSKLRGASPTMQIPADVSMLFNNLMTAKKACMPAPDGIPGTNCSDLAGFETSTRQQILEAILADPAASSYSAGDELYNPEPLFSNTAYPPNTTDPVSMFIDQVGQLGGIPNPRPPTLPEPLTSAQLKNVNAQITSDIQNSVVPSTLDTIQIQQRAYSQAAMQLIAAKNLVMNNFNLIHNKRVSQPTLANQGLKDERNQAITTPLQLESYAANRRLTPDYYKEMAGAPPAAIARETLFALAEIRQQLYQNQLMGERLLATLSVIALGSFSGKIDSINALGKAIQAQIQMLISGSTSTVNDLKNGNVTRPISYGSPSS